MLHHPSAIGLMPSASVPMANYWRRGAANRPVAAKLRSGSFSLPLLVAAEVTRLILMQLEILVPLTPALSLGERENHPAAQQTPQLPPDLQRGRKALPLLGERAGVSGKARLELSRPSQGT